MKELAAVIVETRPLPNLIEIIQNHLKFLPDYTRLYVFGSIAVEQVLLKAGIPCNFIEINRVINEAEYNKLLTSIQFWDLIEEENILIFQHDSEILRTGIEDFYQYEYVGAPWMWQRWGGNGGLSFRKKNAMRFVVSQYPYSQSAHGNEDVYFSNHLVGRKDFPDRSVNEAFSCETIFKLGTFGCHAIDRYMSVDQTSQIRKQYEEASH